MFQVCDKVYHVVQCKENKQFFEIREFHIVAHNPIKNEVIILGEDGLCHKVKDTEVTKKQSRAVKICNEANGYENNVEEPMEVA